ncbi:MAG: hypothetical protein DCC67_08820 [Planctomycetota bacterium]|nr:MAG: hypothetical protein DCC67_08820 [Planctomycetota bacterium]
MAAAQRQAAAAQRQVAATQRQVAAAQRAAGAVTATPPKRRERHRSSADFAPLRPLAERRLWAVERRLWGGCTAAMGRW